MTARRRTARIVDLANQIEADIRRRRLSPGDAYITTAETARMLRASGTTAHKALQVLVKRGVIERKQRRGAVIAEGRYAEVSKNPQVLQAYMGSETVELQGAHG